MVRPEGSDQVLRVAKILGSAVKDLKKPDLPRRGSVEVLYRVAMRFFS
jgi:hypothetical protein